jgi:hypothetical protein
LKSLSVVGNTRLKLIFSNRSAVLIFALTLLFFLPFSRLGVDAHHDGIMFSSALLVRHGLRVQSEVFNQYGPISNLLQSFEILVFGDRLIVLRAFSAIVLAASATFTYLASKRFFGELIAIGAVISWVACAPFLDVDMQMLPWSSDYLLLINSIAILLASSIYVGRTNIPQKKFLIGFLLGINCFVKFHPSVVILLAVVCASCFFVGIQQSWRLVHGVFLSFLSVLAFLFISGSVGDWWLQAVSLPRVMYRSFFQSGIEGFRANILVNGVSGLFSLVLCLWIARSILKFKNFDSPKSTLVNLIRAASLVLLTWIFKIEKGLGILDPRLFLWSVVLGSIIYSAVWVDRIKNTEISKRFPLTVLCAISLGSLLQVFPMVDRRHLWWATLPALVLLLDQIHRHQRKEVKRTFVVLLSVFLLFPSLAHAHATLEVERVYVPNAEVLNGMLVSKDFNAAFGGYIDLIAQFQDIHGDRPVLTFCADGLFTTLGRSLRQPDPYFVYWVFPKDVYDHEARQVFIREFRPMIWVCWPYVDYERSLSNFGYRIVRRPGCLSSIDRFNTFGLSGFLAVPDEWPTIPGESGLERRNVCDSL